MITIKQGRLKDRVAIVTGGARGIGKAIVHKMLMEGACVAVADILTKELHELSEELEEFRAKVLLMETDIVNQDQVEKIVSETVERFATIDILVNNAGIVCPASIENVSSDDWQKVVDVNLKGSYQCARSVIPMMKKKKYGKIVNIGSRTVLGRTDRTVYSATKSGVVGMTRTWALELAAYNINVNCVGPGGIATELFDMVNPKDSEKTKKLIGSIPLKRMGRPQDVANLVAFLSSDEAAHITGQNIYICGGLSIGSY